MIQEDECLRRTRQSGGLSGSSNLGMQKRRPSAEHVAMMSFFFFCYIDLIQGKGRVSGDEM